MKGIGGLAAEDDRARSRRYGARHYVHGGSTAARGPTYGSCHDGRTPPVNFNQGGLVRRGDNQPVQMYANGGETLADFQRMLGVNVTSQTDSSV